MNGPNCSWRDGFSRAEPNQCAGADFRQGSGLCRIRAGDVRDAVPQADADFGLPDNAQSLAPHTLAGAGRRIGGVHAPAHHNTRPALALASEDCRLRASISGNIQIVSRRGRRTLLHGAMLCGAECLARGAGPARGAVALVELMALAAPRGRRRRAGVGKLAPGAAEAMAASGKSDATEGGVGSGANISAARTTFWQCDLAGNDR